MSASQSLQKSFSHGRYFNFDSNSHLRGAIKGAMTTFALVAISLAMHLLASPVVAQTFTVLHSFTGGTDGAYPSTGLILDSSGDLYGTSGSGGSNANDGVVFRVGPLGQESVLARLGGGAKGANPSALVRDNAGNLYGTAFAGGAGHGVVFKVSNGVETVLYAFQGGTDGDSPRAALTIDNAGNLYGTTVQGAGSGCNGWGCGSVFKIDPNGQETILHAFTGVPDGANPEVVALVRDASGNLYGTTFSGGRFNYGTIFKISPTGVETILYDFPGPPNGAYPWVGLTRDSSGNLYGTTAAGDTSTQCTPGCGTIFEFTATGEMIFLHRFTGKSDGTSASELTQDTNGNLYGTTVGAGGTIFRVTKAGVFSTLHRFDWINGLEPQAGVVIDSEGNLFGTAWYGGLWNAGVVYKLKP